MYIYAVQTTEPIIAGKAPDPGSGPRSLENVSSNFFFFSVGRSADGRTGQKKFDLANLGAHNTTITQVKSHSGG